MDPIRRRLTAAAGLLVTVFWLGTLGFWLLGEGAWSLLECAYFVTITLTTVGYGEVLPIRDNPTAIALAMMLMFSGMGVLLYFVSTFTGFIVEGQLQHLLRRRRMERQIAKLKGHIVLCGVGPMGRRVAREFRDTGHGFVVVELDEDALKRLARDLGGEPPYIVGDATDNAVLKEAGIDRARALVACLTNDQDNLFVAISARALNPDIRVISRAREDASVDKLQLAGADHVVQVNKIGGMRLASETIRPEVTGFLDHMLRDPKQTLRLEEIPITEESAFSDKRLSESRIRKATDVLVIAVVQTDGTYRYNPHGDHVIRPGETLIVIGDSAQVSKLRES